MPDERSELRPVPPDRMSRYVLRLGCDRMLAGGGRGEVSLPLSQDHTNHRGVAHGGVTTSLLDTALGAAVVTAIRPEEWCGTVQLDVQFIAPAVGTRLTARGEVVRRGRHIAYARGDMVDDAGRLVATATGTWYVWSHRPAVPRPVGPSPEGRPPAP